MRHKLVLNLETSNIWEVPQIEIEGTIEEIGYEMADRVHTEAGAEVTKEEQAQIDAFDKARTPEELNAALEVYHKYHGEGSSSKLIAL